MTKAPPEMAIGFRLVDAGWDKLLDSALRADRSSVRIVSPFIKKNAAERILKHGRPKALQVITRYNLDDFCEGVSDIAALRFLLDNGAHIRGVRNLHAKLYLFGETRTIVTSANLTDAALLRNHEFGFVAEDSKIIGRCQSRRPGERLDPPSLTSFPGGSANQNRLSSSFSEKVRAEQSALCLFSSRFGVLAVTGLAVIPKVSDRAR